MSIVDNLKQVAQYTTDPEGHPVVQIPLSSWKELLNEMNPEQTEDEGSIENNRDLSKDLFLLLAQSTDKADFHSGRTDIAENFDDIVGKIIAEEYIKRRDENGSR